MESPLLNIRLYKVYKRYTKLICFFGCYVKYFMENTWQLDISKYNLIRIYEGRHFFLSNLKKISCITFFANNYNVMYSNNIYSVLNMVSNYISSAYFSSLVQSDCVSVGVYNLGIVPKYKSKTLYSRQSSNYNIHYSFGRAI